MAPHLTLKFTYRDRNSMGEARNQALWKCETQWLAFLDSDCVVGRLWFTQVINEMNQWNSREEVWGWSGPALNRGHSFMDRVIRQLGQWFSAHRNVRNVERVFHLPTCGVFYRVQPVLQAGGIPNGFPRVGEDLALSHVVRKNGGILMQTPKPVILHQQQPTLSSWMMRMLRYGEAQGLVARKFPAHLFSKRVFPALFILVLVLSFAVSPIVPGAWLLAALGCFSIPNRRQSGWRPLPISMMMLASTLTYGIGTYWGLVRWRPQ